MSRKIAILGGGITGLCSAWNLITKSPSTEVVLYEASNRVGGWLRTKLTSEGAVFECGPRSLRTAGNSAKSTMKLVSALGMDSQVLPVPSTSGAAKKRLVYTNKDGLVQLPAGPSWLFRTKPPFTKPLLGAVLKEVLTKPGSVDETIFDFFSRRTSGELAKYIVDPLCRGVYASNARTLSVRACFPQLVELEGQHGSIVRGMLLDRSAKDATDSSPLSERAKREKWSVYSFKNGLQYLPDTLLADIKDKGVCVKMEQPCSKLTFLNGKAMVEAAGVEEEYDHVVSTVSAKALSRVLPDEPQLSADLASIPYVSVGVVGLEYKARDILPQEHREAFGYLVPSSEVSRILGVVFDSASFPSQDRRDTPSTRLTVMMGGEWFGELFGNPNTVHKDTLSQVALEELHRQLGITAQPSYINSMVLKDGIPQYIIGHNEKLDSITNHLSSLPLSVCGSSYRGVSVNDCVHQAFQVTNKLLK